MYNLQGKDEGVTNYWQITKKSLLILTLQNWLNTIWV